MIEVKVVPDGSTGDATWPGVQVPAGSKYGFNFAIDDTTAAYTLATALAGANNDMDFTAVTAGQAAGEAVRVVYSDPGGVTAALAVSVSGSTVTVSLARAASAITSTAAQIKTAIDATPAAAALVTCANHAGNDGSGIVTAMAGAAFTAPTVALTGKFQVSLDGVTYSDLWYYTIGTNDTAAATTVALSALDTYSSVFADTAGSRFFNYVRFVSSSTTAAKFNARVFVV